MSKRAGPYLLLAVLACLGMSTDAAGLGHAQPEANHASVPRPTPQIPSRIVNADGDVVWRSTEDVMSASGEWLGPRPRLLDGPYGEEFDRRREARVAGSDVDDCLNLVIARRIVGYVLPTSLDQAVSVATSVVAGQVVSAREGFWGGSPAILLELGVDNWLRRPEDFPRARTLLVAYPKGRVQLGPDAVCRTNSDLPTVPAIGDELLILAQANVRELDGHAVLSLIPDGRELLVRRASGSVEMGKPLASLAETDGMSWEDVRRSVRRALRQGGAR